MDWGVLLKSVVVAAVISSVVAGIGFLVSAWTARKINNDKLELDKKLAEYRAKVERDLAERKIELDHRLSLSKRRAEVAEKVLADFYRGGRAFDLIRSPMIWASEMVREEDVAEDVITNDGYGVIRRIREHSDLFAELDAHRPTFGALFGVAATAPFGEMTRAHNQVLHAAQDLLKYRHQADSENLKEHMRRMRRVAFSNVQLDDEGVETPDRLSESIAKAIAQIEATCRPALEGGVLG